MQEGLLEELVRKQLDTELSNWLQEWENCLLPQPYPVSGFESQGEMREFSSLTALRGHARLAGLAESPRLARLIELTRQSRNIARLTANEEMEAVAVSLEALLTLTSETDLPDTNIRKTILLGAELLRKNLVYDLANSPEPSTCARIPLSGPAFVSMPLSPLSASVIERLQIAVKSLATGGAYGGLGVCFSVIHNETDTTPLRLRGLDLFRLEQKNVRLYLLEMPWQEVLDRNRGLITLLEYLGRNGQVFDIRTAETFLHARPESAVNILRILYGAPLDLDFVEALIRLPSEHIHSVNPAMVRKNQPSWGLVSRPEPLQTLQQQACSRSVDELTREYTLALNRLFTESKSSTIIWNEQHVLENHDASETENP